MSTQPNPVAKKKRAKAKTSNQRSLPTDEFIVIKPEGSSDETIDQKRMREFKEIQDARSYFNQQYEKILQENRKAIQDGAEIKHDGKMDMLYKVRSRRSVSYKEEVARLKGRDYQKACLDGPHARRHEYLHITIVEGKTRTLVKVKNNE